MLYLLFETYSGGVPCLGRIEVCKIGYGLMSNLYAFFFKSDSNKLVACLIFVSIDYGTSLTYTTSIFSDKRNIT